MQPFKPLFYYVFFRLVCGALLGFGFLISSSSFSWGGMPKISPSLTYATFHSDHFRVYAPCEDQKIAARFLDYLEEAYFALCQELTWRVTTPIDVVIRSDVDSPDAYASVFPSNRLVFYTTPFSSPHWVGEYDDWLRLLVYHELSHVVANDMTNGVLKWGRKIFGSAAKLNPYQPQWMIEGLAVYYETSQAQDGRGRSALMDMVLRAAVMEGLVYSSEDLLNRGPHLEYGVSFDRLNDGPPIWPHRHTPYVFGYLMNEWFSLFGQAHTPAQISHFNSERIPFWIDPVAKRIFKKSYSQIWDEGVAELKKIVQEDLNQIHQQKLSSMEKIVSAGRESRGVVFSKKKQSLFYIEDSYQKGVGITQTSTLQDQKNKRLMDWKWGGGMRLRLTPDEENLIYSRIQPDLDYHFFSDVFLYDLKNGKEVPVTKGMRAFDPDVSEDFSWDFKDQKIKTGQIVYVKAQPDANQAIVLFDGFREEQLDQGENFERFSYPSWGRGQWKEWIVFSKKRNGFSENLWLIHSKTHEKIEITPSFRYTQSRNQESQPSWNTRGGIDFSSAIDGIYNIYEISSSQIQKKIESSQSEVRPIRVTHVQTGAFFPTPSEDPSFIYSMVYGGGGYDVFRIQKSTQKEGLRQLSPPLRSLRDKIHQVQADAVRATAVHVSGPPLQESVYQKKDSYSVFPSLWPQYWFFYASAVPSGWLGGIRTSGSDPLEKNRYEAVLGKDSRADFPFYHLKYIYDGFYPSLFLETHQENQYIEFFKQSNRLIRQNVAFALPLEERVSLSIGGTLLHSHFFNETAHSGGAQVQILYQDGKNLPETRERLSGHLFSLGGTSYFVGDESFNSIHLEGKEQFSLGMKQDAFTFRFQYSASNNKNFSSQYYLGGGETHLFQNTTHLLRGYLLGSIYGRKILTLNQEYRFPLKRIYRGWGDYPLFLEKTMLSFFCDVGSAEYVWAQQRRLNQWPVGVGVRLLNDLNVFYRVPITVGVGFDWGLRKDLGGERQILVGLSSRLP